MDRADLYATVARIIADLADVPIETVVPQAQLDDLDVDSITKIEMLGQLRKALHVPIPDGMAANLVRVVDVVNYLSTLPVPADKP